ncbi:MAG: hypothetical protein IPL27_03150 [Lewinellaceae bacterium]|nr:hypothetical protein [Lewinellaceae bacterium]
MEDLFSDKIGCVAVEWGTAGYLRAGVQLTAVGKNCVFDRRIKRGFNEPFNFLLGVVWLKFETIPFE